MLGKIKNIFKPEKIILKNGKEVQPKASVAPFVIIGLFLSLIVAGDVTGFNFETIIKRGNEFFVILKDMFPPNFDYMKTVIPPLIETIKISVLGSLIGSFIALTGLIHQIYLLGKILYRKIRLAQKYKVYKITTLLIQVSIFAGIAIYGINNLYNYIKVEKNERIDHYKNIEISEGLIERIDEIDAYISEQENNGKKVYILDAEAAIYMIPLNKYNKDYDMFLKGNIGKDGEQGQIEKIQNRNDNELYLIRNSKLRSNWQTPLNVVNYVRNNLEKIGEISIYEVFK